MTISVVSAQFGGDLLAAAAGDIGAGEFDAPAFGGLLAFLLKKGAAAGEIRLDTGTDAALGADFIQTPDTGPDGLDGLDVLGLLSRENPLEESPWAGMLERPRRDAEKGDAKEAQESSESVPLLALTPEIRQDASPKNVSSDTDLLNAERHNPPFDLKTSALLAEKGAAPYNTANFAVPLEKSSALPHEPLPPEPLPQGQTVLHQASTPGALSQNAQTPAAGSGLQTPLFNPEWAQEFGEKIVWMAKNDQQQAHLSLNPAHLGPLRITLNLEADKAFATFTASTPEARQAIEEALPRLREMLSGAGIFLGDAQVGAQSREEARFSHAQYGESHPGNAGDTAILEDGPLSERAMMSARQKEGLVDLFA